MLAPGGQALSGFVQTAVTDTADSINPTGGLDLLNDLGGFAAEQDTPTEAPAGKLPGL